MALRSEYESIRQEWPKIREAILKGGGPEAEALVRRIETLDAKLRQAVTEAEKTAKETARKETQGLKERIAETLGRVDAMKEAINLIGQYVQSRREGESPKAAALGVIDEKLKALETKLEARVQSIGRGDIATALTYVGIPSIAATIISFFLAGAIRRKGDDAIKAVLAALEAKVETLREKS